MLDYTNAPRTVANFVGLAAGQRAWLDLPSGKAKTNAFYDGLNFHRVVSGFVIQAGSPNGTGGDGPGYAFPDEFSPALVFTNFGVMAMANSGTNSNGSQFFITVAPFTSGNNTYSIFGKLVSGSNVVYAISQVATDANQKPLTNVVMQQVQIRRVGTAAQAFDVNAHGLPVVTNLPLTISNAGSQVSLTFSNRLFADNQLYSGTNITSRSANALGIEVSSPVTNRTFWIKDAPTRFFSLAQVQYASSTFAPKSVVGKTIVVNFTQTGETFTNVVTSTTAGTYGYKQGTNAPASGSIQYLWQQQPYRGVFEVFYSSPLDFQVNFQLNFTNSTGGLSKDLDFGYTGTFSLN